MTRTAAKPDLALEHDILADVREVFERLGCTVIRFSERRRSLVTPGVADLKVCVLRKRCAFWFEVKTPSGVQSADQRAFQQLVESCGEVYRIGGTEAALTQLRAIGVLPA